MRRYYWIAGIIVLILFVVGASVHMYVRWQRDQYIGEVIQAADDVVVIHDVRGRELLVHILPTTEVRPRERDVTQLHAGESVMVFGDERDGSIQATLIRVLGDGDWNSGMPRAR